MSWRFRPMERGEMNIDPFEREFFATEALEKVAEPLVREAIQNSLDAASGETVVVRLALGRAEEADKSDYLEGLWPHVEAALDGAAEPPGRAEPFTYLVVEDLGTRGLEGDPAQYEDESLVGVRNDFYYFWRNVGRSRKESNDRGRWGLGKTVFAAASRMQTFLGATVRASDGRSLLMGQAVLKIHRLGGQRYQPYGYYGDHDEQGFALPVEDPSAVRRFAERFCLRRSGDPGLSIVIPYPDPAITADELVESVLHHYFHPLLTGKLRVEVAEGSSSTLLERDSLEQGIRRARRKELRDILPVLDLARWGLEPPEEARAKVAPPAPGRAPKLASDLFEASDLERLRRRYDAGQRVALSLGGWVQRAKGDPVETRFQLLLERDEKLQRGEGHFVRQGITIANPNARRPRGVRWIVVISDEALSAFLGDAENPAHTEWQRSSPKFKEKYRLGPSTLDFVKGVPHGVAGILSRPAEGRDPNLLRGVFSLSDDAAMDAPSRQRTPTKKDDESATGDMDLGDFGRGGKLVLSRVQSGFRLTGRKGENPPPGLRIVVAYELLRGDAFRRYSPLDFRLDSKSITLQASGIEVRLREENRLELDVGEEVFEVLVTGFDIHRDLRIKVSPTGDEG